MLTWTPDPSWPDEPPPLSAVVVETCEATASGTKVNAASGSSASASASGDNGLGVSDSSPGVVSSDGSSTLYSVDCSGSRYSVQSGATITVTCSPTANATSIPAGASVNVNYDVTATPVTIVLAGLTYPDSPNNCVLTGQQVVASLSAGVGTPSGYNWTMSGGEPFNNFFVAADQSEGEELPLTTANRQAAELRFFTKEVGSVTVSCTATVTFPDGTPGSVQAVARAFASQKPTVVWQIESNRARFNIDPAEGPTLNPSYFSPFNINPAAPFPEGQTWNATISVPFGSGEGAYVQLVTPARYLYKSSTEPPPLVFRFPNNGLEGLDGAFPYDIHGQPLVWELPAILHDSLWLRGQGFGKHRLRRIFSKPG